MTHSGSFGSLWLVLSRSRTRQSSGKLCKSPKSCDFGYNQTGNY